VKKILQITNDTTFSVTAFCQHKDYGNGDKKVIKPGETMELQGPWVGEMGDESGYIQFTGRITCHEKPDNNTGYQVTKEEKLILQLKKRRVTVEYAID